MSIFEDKPGSFTLHNDDFQSGLTVGGAGQSHEISPYECATPAAASRLLAHVTTLGLAPALTTDWPLGDFAENSPFAQSAKVPYFNFPKAATPEDPRTFYHVNVARLLVAYDRYGKFADVLLVQWFGGKQ
jgi:hypothetical protein